MPPLDVQQIDIPLGASGLREDVDSRALPPGALTRMDNYVVTASGAVEKRAGYGPLGGNRINGVILPSSTARLVAGAELHVVGDHGDDSLPRMFTYDEASDAWNDTTGPYLPPLTIERRPMVRGTVGVYQGGAVAFDDGTEVHVWTLVGIGHVVRIVNADGVPLANDSLIEATSAGALFSARVIRCANRVLIFYINSAFTGINVRTIDSTAPTTISGDTAVVSGFVLLNLFDVWPLSSTRLQLVWGNATDNGIRARLINPATLATTTGPSEIVAPGVTAFSYLSVCGNMTSSFIVYGSIGVGATDAAYTTSFTSLLHDTIVTVTHSTTLETLHAMSCCLDASGQCVTVYDAQATTTDQRSLYVKVTNAAGATYGHSQRTFFAFIGSRPFLQGTLVYMHTGAGIICALTQTVTTAQNASTGAGGPARMVGTVADSQSAQTYVLPGYILTGTPGWIQVSGTRALVPLTVIQSAFDSYDAQATAVDRVVCEFDRDANDLWSYASVRGAMFFAGGLTSYFDGVACSEVGFLGPPSLSATAVAPAATGIAAGTYYYVAVYESIDAVGNVHRSAPSSVESVTVAADGSMSVAITYLPFTIRGEQSNLRAASIVLYRSTVNAAAPVIYYRMTKRDSFTTANPNNRFDDVLTIADATTDAALTALGYGTLTEDVGDGGILPADYPGPSRHIVDHRNRVWIVSSYDEHVVWYSRALVAGEAPAFSAYLRLRFDDAPSGLTALGSVEEQLFAFTRNRTYRIVGDGPNDAGTGGTLTTYLVSNDTGCVSSRSVVAFPGGCLFQSESGLCIASSGGIQRISGPAQDTLRAYPTVLRAAHDPAGQVVKFLLSRESSDPLPEWLDYGDEYQGEVLSPPTRLTLVFNYRYGLWHTESYGVLEPDDLVFHDGAFHLLQGRQPYRQGFGDVPGYDDEDTWVTGTVETPWILAGGGWQRVRRLVITGRRKTAHTLNVHVLYDHRRLAGVTHTFDVGADSDVMGLPTMRLRAHLAKQKCGAVKFLIQDEAPSGVPVDDAPTGCSLSGLKLEVGVKKGVAKFAAVNRA